MSGGSIEATLELWASLPRDIKTRMRPLFKQERMAMSSGLFLDGSPRRISGAPPATRAGNTSRRPPATWIGAARGCPIEGRAWCPVGQTGTASPRTAQPSAASARRGGPPPPTWRTPCSRYGSGCRIEWAGARLYPPPFRAHGLRPPPTTVRWCTMPLPCACHRGERTGRRWRCPRPGPRWGPMADW